MPDKRNADLVRQLGLEVDAAAAADLERLDYKIILGALHELRHAFEQFTPYRTKPKVTIFGSARIPREDENYLIAHRFGELMANNHWIVVTGGGPGIMEAGIAGAGPAHSFGVGIRLPFEEHSDLSASSHFLEMKYFFTRKLLMTKESQAFVCFPGGLGTLDETFEVFTLMQTGKAPVAPLILCEKPGAHYWEEFTQFLKETPLSRGLINQEDLSLIGYAHSAEEAAIQVTQFYGRFHSLRTVGDHLIIRLSSPLKANAIRQLGQDFADITAGGTVREGTASPWERREHDYVDLPRLWLTFDKRSYGRLRQFIDAINTADGGSD